MIKRSKRVLVGFHLVEALRDVLQGIISYSKAQSTNWEVQCVDLEEFEERMTQRGIDGAIAHINPALRTSLNRLLKSGVPLVNTLHDTSPLVTSVLSDDPGIGSRGAEYFLAKGFRNFAFIGVQAEWSKNRQAGFTRFLRSHREVEHLSESVIPHHLHCAIESKALRAQLRGWVKKLPKPTAIMACSDKTARALLAACVGNGISVPEEVAILGVNNLIGTCELASVPLSSVSQDFPMIGKLAARILDRMMSGAKPDCTATLVAPGPIIVRRSTDVFAFDDKQVAEAMRMIHEQAGRGLHMKQLTSHMGVSRNSLDNRFRMIVGHSPSEEIRRVRLNRVKELLTATNLTVREIALRCGFGTSENLIHVFHRSQKIAPLEYRQNSRSPIAVFEELNY